MGVFCALLVWLAIVCVVEPKSQTTNATDTRMDELYTRLEKRGLALERTHEEAEIDTSAPAQLSKLNDTNLEERVQALEFQLSKMESQSQENVNPLLHNDTNLEERVQALEFQMENVHEDMTVIEGEISVINTEQDIQTVTAVTDDLQTSVVSLQETDAGIIEDINQLTEVDGTLDSRLSQLEVGVSDAK